MGNLKILRTREGKMGAYAQLALVIVGFIILAVIVFPKIGQWILELVRAFSGS